MKTKVIVCPNKEVGGTPINYIVEFYDATLVGGVAARDGGWHVPPRLAYEHTPYHSTVVAAERLERYLADMAKTCTIERW